MMLSSNARPHRRITRLLHIRKSPSFSRITRCSLVGIGDISVSSSYHPYSQLTPSLSNNVTNIALPSAHQIRTHHYHTKSSKLHLPPRLTIARASRLLRTPKNSNEKMLTSEQLCQHSHNLATFGEDSLQLNAYAKLLPLDQILEQARVSDERLKSGNPKSLLDGIPVTIKANIAVGKWWEMPNAGSAILTHSRNVPHTIKGNDTAEGAYESDIARKLLKDCGAVLIGITNMDEFGMGSLGINNGLHSSQEKYSPTYNPIPWMHRLSLLLPVQPIDGIDEYFLRQIQKSTIDNPHAVDDTGALDDLLDEVRYWTTSTRGDETTKYSNQSSPLLSPGGSSSGAAAATSHGSSLLSIGTDTGGSLRLPSAWTSTVGFKPSYGTWSRYGVVSYASSLDTVGFVAGSTECAEIAWRCLDNYKGTTGWNATQCRDPTARIYHAITTSEDRSYLQQSSSDSTDTKPLQSVRIGIPTAFSLEESPPLISQTWSEGANLLQFVGGATLVSIPETKVSSQWVKLSCAAYYVLACAEASSNLSRYDGVRFGMDIGMTSMSDADFDADNNLESLSNMTVLEKQISATRSFGFGDEVQRRVLAGTSVLSSDRFHTHYEAAALVRAKLSRSLEGVFRSESDTEAMECDEGKVDVILIPTALSFPCTLKPKNGDGAVSEIDSTAAFANDVMTIPISLGGFPSVSVPFQVSTSEGNDCDDVRKVVGLQVFGARGSEATIFKVAQALSSRR
jgi:aspartyl-tRNA(Asn)/glutamyl-tRNA(Gln) amidotransferase subunit A